MFCVFDSTGIAYTYPEVFYAFNAIVNGFLISFSNGSLIVYLNTLDFFLILAECVETLLMNLLVLVVFYRFLGSFHVHYHTSANKESFTFSFPFCMHLFPFPILFH